MSFKGQLNIYTCDVCKKHIVTKDVDEGVTPFMTSCKSTPLCKGYMISSMYRVYDQTMKPDYEWYKPHIDDVAFHVRDHVENGGLILRKVTS